MNANCRLHNGYDNQIVVICVYIYIHIYVYMQY